MKTKEILFALLLGILTLASCKKEEVDDYSIDSNYLVEKINVSSLKGRDNIITPFKGQGIEFTLERKEYEYENFDFDLTSLNEDIIVTKGTSLRLTPTEGCTIDNGRRIGTCSSTPWLEGELIEEAPSLYWRVVGLFGNFTEEANDPRFFLFECEIDGEQKYGWVKMTATTIEFVIPKNDSETFEIGIKK